MNKEELKQIIRSIVREEVERALPNVLVEILASKVGDREIVAEAAQAPQRRPAPQPQRSQQKFSSNPVLNRILQETQGGVPADPEAQLVSAEMPVPGAQTSIIDKLRAIPKAQLAENKEVAGVLNVLNRDFRQTVRAIDKSAGRVPPPNFKMQPGMFDDAV